MQSKRTTVRRLPDRGAYDSETVHQILDSNFLCHVGFNAEHGPVVLPTLYGRDGDTMYLHGSSGAHMLRSMRTGIPVSVAVTTVDGIVAARSLFHHSINYRSVVVFGTATEVTDVQEKLHGLEIVTNHVLPGRWDEARHPNTAEFTQTLVLKLGLEEASAKVRVGPPHDEPADLEMDVWAGVIPLSTHAGEPVSDPDLDPATALSPSVSAALERWGP
ncbi:MAG: pyridoxamine 5'-phosphate oxidase family protein [Chloroflexi bacterium]|nr:pyridoxamine 5'-phosphate oxidase family protein [Chloroflexota bacterium]MDA1296415.1 pyridoxamine 5'-phosphate oxidase family protein [Chloroflexota bacterium]